MSHYHFNGCTIDTEGRTLRVNDAAVEVQPLIFDLLTYFVRHPHRVIGRRELLNAVWRSPAVSDSVVARAVMKARRAIGDTEVRTLIVTAARAGYRFRGDVTAELPDERVGRVADPFVSVAEPVACESEEALAVMQFDRASELEQQGHFREALELLRPCLPRLEATAQVQLLHAKLLLQCGQPEEAQALLQSALARSDAAPGRPVRIELLLAQATCLTRQEQMLEACARCDEALDLAESDAQGRKLVPAVLLLHARLLQRRGEFDAAVRAAQRAVSLAATLEDVVLEARARLQLASVLVFIERTDQAADAAALAAAHARRCGLLSLEADAVRMQATLRMSRRECAQAERLARHAADLCSATGDLGGLVSSRLLTCFALIECERIDEAQQVLHALGDALDLPGDKRASAEIATAVLAWKRGRAADSIDRLRRLVEHSVVDMTKRVAAFELLLQLVDVGRLQEAHGLLEYVRADPKRERGVAASAALDLAGGRRTQAIDALRSFWLSRPGNTNTGMDICIDLAWLLLEDEEPRRSDPLLDALAASLLDYGPDLLCAQVIRAAYRLRRAPSAETRARWKLLVDHAMPLRRHKTQLGSNAYELALMAGSPPPLKQLLSRACF